MERALPSRQLFGSATATASATMDKKDDDKMDVDAAPADPTSSSRKYLYSRWLTALLSKLDRASAW